MRRFRHFSQSKTASSEINMSPLIDIVFILLIFFVVTTVFIDDSGVEINRPQARSAEEIQKNSILIAVTKNGDVFYGGRNVGVEGVRTLVTSLLSDDSELPVIIQGDEEVSHGVIMRVTDAAQMAGAQRVYSATAK